MSQSKQQAYRLDTGGRIDRSRTLSFTFNGQRYQGQAGDTLASALLANGVDIVNRSFKYSRPRGIVAAGAEEPNAIVQLGSSEAAQVPNVRATQQALFDGLTARSTNGWPNVQRDMMGLVGKIGGQFMPPGFYYKTFMAPASMWMTYEKYIRKAAGLGRSPLENDPDSYDHLHQHCDVLVVGAGAAGLSAALAAARSGARVIVADEQEEMGGSLLDTREMLAGNPADQWVAQVLDELAGCDNVTLLPRTTANGYHDHNFVTLHERRTEHLGETAPVVHGHRPVRSRMHRVRAGQVILATGAHERPLVYAGNDIPGNLLAGAVSTYIRRYGVVPGRRLVLSTSNDYGYRAALDWKEAGHDVVAIVDAREAPKGDWIDAARAQGIKIVTGSAVIEAKGSNRVTAARVAPIDIDAFKVNGAVQELACDTIASSGGYSPVIHLASHTGARPTWRDEIIGFVPGLVKGVQACGGANGTYALGDVLAAGIEAGIKAAAAMGKTTQVVNAPSVEPLQQGQAVALFQVPHEKATTRAPKQFVDLQNDVTAAGIELATREGFESIEHVKRYTAMGFGTDQGKLGNINGMAIAARCLRRSIPEVGTTVFRPNYTPVTFGAIVGRHCRELFDPERYTALHQWHVERGAEFEDVGQWKRPWYYPQKVNGKTETMHEAVARECLAVREKVGILDASTLGKIDIQGPDAREFLARVYTNKWEKLAVGKCRYGLMCKDDGMVTDDGVTSCLAENHFLMTTTTGGAAAILEWLELWHQTEWPELDVYFTSVTDHWATMTVTGPEARKLLSEITDIDLDRDGFKFMEWRSGKVADVPARVFRISFTGELTFEINVQANYAMHVWQTLFKHGEKYGLTPYGTETMHVLRAEKGFIIVGQETDGSVTPEDLGMHWCVGYDKPFSWIGKRALTRSDTKRENRKQLVGLRPKDPKVVLEEGAQIVFDPNHAIPMPMAGHVTSSYYSPTLGAGFALAVVKGGLKKMGETVYLPMADGQTHEAEIVSSVFYDPKGERQNV
ncbi:MULTISPECIES: sarcosine oxidase subunit alpha family protein [Halomonadaceae]|uniref:Sarcosine oxidase subunit alpha family protein n=1 Tax=Vreelandella piezotolerans TaxID=2609667 RepID=A0ABQ6XDN1_9GAMM|nr:MULTISPECIES: sarcosine oxidase subunit alpha family protein [Halomonas]KAE8440112.1 sarcosine oxidase subunit alpha family protein [Halomonas piezotolerans]MCG7590740.1 sarcosine oxidase subunit alpha family protein [Halomonas sp. McD50-5]MCG7616852.1 sarcosine oxidase subunit alpha family protein [Halomonas sp. McD50-4]QJA23648.1 sarcosine oxidase subunit alpha family protein [Halomonas piezotolerans]